MWNGNVNQNLSGAGGNGVGGDRQTPRPMAPHSEDPSVHDLTVQPHLNFAPAYNQMQYYPPYYEYPNPVLQQQRMELEMLTAAAHLQHQQLDYDRTRAALAAAHLLRGRAAGVSSTEELPVRMDDDLRLQSQQMIFPPSVTTIPNQMGYNIYSSLAPTVHPASLRMMMDHAGGGLPNVAPYSGMNVAWNETSSALDDSNTKLKHVDDSVETKQVSNSPVNHAQQRVTESRLFDSNITMGDPTITGFHPSHDITSPADENPSGDVLTRLDTLPIRTSDKQRSNNKGEKDGEAIPDGILQKVKKSTPIVTSSTKKTPNSSKQGKSSSSSFFSMNHHLLQTGIHPSLGDSVPSLNEADYANLEALMTQFCLVPFLAEFCRPVSVLHPDLVPSFSRVIRQPIDLGIVCRRIHNRMYKSGRAVCLDVWRVFSNCIKFHTHPSTRDISIPSFVSIATHLSDYFTSLWLEYMLPSDTPDFPQEYVNSSLAVSESVDETITDDCSLINFMKRDPYIMSRKNSFAEREKRRQTRFSALCHTTYLTAKTLIKISNCINAFVDNGGSVDIADPSLMTVILEKNGSDCLNPHIPLAMEQCFSNLRTLSEKLVTLAALESENAASESNDPGYTLADLQNDLNSSRMPTCAHTFLTTTILARLNRIVGQVTATIYEINNRGVNQSSIWGCSAAVIWARESAKRPFWPALVIGVLASNHQKEPWHEVLTDVNELRLPDKLRSELINGKKKAEANIRTQTASDQASFFLVEFLGSHEFIWVREGDILEKFDPNEDPNQEIMNGSKKRNRALVPANIKSFQKAIEEGQWAMEELNVQMTDPCGDMAHDFFKKLDLTHTFDSLCSVTAPQVTTDEEANIIECADDVLCVSSPGVGVLTDLEEMNELLATNGLINLSVDGRKHAKKRAVAIKRYQSENKRIVLKTDKEFKDDQKHDENPKKTLSYSSSPKIKFSSKVIEDKSSRKSDSLRKEKELLKRRKKREREREKLMKEEDRKLKKQKTDHDNIVRIGRRYGFVDKRGRARAVVRGYLHRLSKEEDVLNILSLDGMTSVSVSSVEASSLIGLAVAFRAAAGEIDMPASSDFVLPVKPWEKIDTDSPVSSQERCERLEKKILLLQKALDRLAENNKRRELLIDEAVSEKDSLDAKIENEEKTALLNDIPKKKSVITKQSEACVDETSAQE